VNDRLKALEGHHTFEGDFCHCDETSMRLTAFLSVILLFMFKNLMLSWVSGTGIDLKQCIVFLNPILTIVNKGKNNLDGCFP